MDMYLQKRFHAMMSSLHPPQNQVLFTDNLSAPPAIIWFLSASHQPNYI